MAWVAGPAAPGAFVEETGDEGQSRCPMLQCLSCEACVPRSEGRVLHAREEGRRRFGREGIGW